MTANITARERQENWEIESLASWASKAALSRGRKRPEEPDNIRTAYQRDRDRIIHSKAFRRLKHKTQVFIDPEEDHFRTRLTHTLEVAQISRTIARALRLNEDLTEAIALAHDLGHPPFGHAGEEALNMAYKEFVPEASFVHYEQSLRVVDYLEHLTDDEKDTQPGLNLTWEVLDGIAYHSKGSADLNENEVVASTYEGQVMRLADRVAYINHDIDDSVRAGIITYSDLPKKEIAKLGRSHSQRIGFMVSDIVAASEGRAEIVMSDEGQEALDNLKDFMFERVYWNAARGNEDLRKSQHVILSLFRLYMEQPDLMAIGVSTDSSMEERAQSVCDFVAGMTDRYAISKFEKHFVPQGMRGGQQWL